MIYRLAVIILIAVLLVVIPLPGKVSIDADGMLSVTNYAAYANPGVAFVRVTEGTSIGTSLTLNIQVDGTDRVLVVGLSYKSNEVVIPTSVLFNTSENFTIEEGGIDGGDAQCFLYYLTAPTVTTADVVITMDAARRMVGYVALFTGVDQTNPFTANTNNAQGVDAAPTVDVSSAADEIVVDILAQVSAGPDTAAGAHTEICDGAAIGGGTDTRGASQYVVGQATRTMNYTMSDADNWNIIAGALQEPQAVCSPNISNSPSTHDFGIVTASANYTTGIANFTVINSSGGAIDISIQGTDMTGGNTWDLSDTATPGANIYGLKAGLDDADDNYDIIVKEDSPYNDLITGLADSANTSWGLQLFAPTSMNDGVEKTCTVTLTATCQ